MLTQGVLSFQYCPELVLVAAGFDAGEGDPMVNVFSFVVGEK